MGAEGVLWGQVSSPTLTRYHGNDSGNTLYSPASQAVAKIYFDALLPWGAMGRVSLRPDGSVSLRCNVNTTSLQTGDNCYSDTDDTGGEQKMVYVPQFCYYCDYVAAHNIVWWVGQIGDTFTLQAADGTFTGGTYTFSSSDIHPAFIVDGVAKPCFYISAYEGYKNTNFRGAGITALESIAGVTPTVSTTKANFRTYAEAIGVGWELTTIQVISALQYLFPIEYGSLHAYATLGRGLTSSTANTGTTTANGNASYGVPTDSNHTMSYRGVENVYGNYQMFTEGVRIKANYGVWIAPQTNDRVTYPYQDSTWGLPYVNQSISVPSASNDINSVFSTLPWAFIPATVGGGLYGAYFCSAYRTGMGDKVVCHSIVAGGMTGIFGFDITIGSTGTNALYGARTQFISP